MNVVACPSLSEVAPNSTPICFVPVITLRHPPGLCAGYSKIRTPPCDQRNLLTHH
jgi:hypothetical protein